MYNTMIRAYATSPNPHLSFIVFLEMLCNVLPDKYSFTFILKACAATGNVKQGQQVHSLVIKNGLLYDNYVLNTLIHMYAKSRCFAEARVLLDRSPTDDVIAWNALLSVYTELGLTEFAGELFTEMPVKNLESWNFMLSGYVKCGLIDEARSVFDKMLAKNVVSWNAMLSGYAQAGRFNEVILLFKDMQRSDMKPDDCTLVNVLSACAGVGGLSQGKWVHAYIDKNEIEVHGFLATTLVDMYSKCGDIGKALEVFESTVRKDISTWNSMIVGLSIHGLAEQALKVFDEMVATGIKPNGVTFVCLLSACSHGGLLNEGCEMFYTMVSDYGIQPAIEHYGCMVDLLGRFGFLKEAEELVREIPVEEAPAIWESLLSACRNHNHVELAKHIATKLLESNPQESSSYVQLSNVHALMGRWDEAMEVRRKMRSHGVTKEPGCSIIEIDGVVHKFLAGEGIIT